MRTSPAWHAIVAAAIAIGTGGGLWVWAASSVGRLEGWDNPAYFARVVPALWVVSAVCGFLVPRHAWRWPALIYVTQFIVMMSRTEGTVGPLAPLGFIMMAVLALISAAPAYAGAVLRRFATRRRSAGSE